MLVLVDFGFDRVSEYSEITSSPAHPLLSETAEASYAVDWQGQ